MTPWDAERIARARANLAEALAEGVSPLELTRWCVTDVVVQSAHPHTSQQVLSMLLYGDIDTVREGMRPSANFFIGTLLELGWTHPDISADDIETIQES